MPQLELIGLTKLLGGRPVLRELSLSADAGEIVVIFGPSGSGKTVLLRLLAGLDQADAGAILIGGKDVTEAAPEARGLGMAFQNFALFPHMSAFDNIASALAMRRLGKSAVRAKVEAVADLLKIRHVLEHAPRELSNGQKQRTALARALVAEPKVLLLDDPLRNVDAKLRYEMRLELPSLLKASGATVLYITQDYREAMALGDRIAVLLDGAFAQVAPPADIYSAPATIGVARLFGDPAINLLPVTVQCPQGRPRVAIGNVPLSLPAGYAYADGRSCVLGLRPESIRLNGADAPESLPVELAAVTPLNERTVLLLNTADGLELLASEVGTENLRQPGPAHAAFDPSAVLLFDSASGGRLPPRPH